MSTTVVTRARLGLFERYLSLWVALCIAVGILLGHLAPDAFAMVAQAELAKVNLPLAAPWL